MSGVKVKAYYVCNMDLIDLIIQVSPHLCVEKLKLASSGLNPFCYIQFLLRYHTYLQGSS